MIKFDDVTKGNIKHHNQNWPQIPDHPYRRLWIWKNKFIFYCNKSASRY